MKNDFVRLKVPMLCGNLGPGYDTFGLALKHYNFVEMRKIPVGLKVEISGHGDDFLPRDTSCEVFKAARLIFEKAGEHLAGMEIRLENNIPVGKGLGSFAGAVAAGVYGANLMLGEPFTPDQLISFSSLKVGSCSNTAAALSGNFVIVSRHEECYFTQRFPDKIQPVVFVPDPVGYNPQELKRCIPKKVNLEDANFNIAHTALLILALEHSDCSHLMKIGFSDRLAHSTRMSFFPGIREVFLYMQSISNDSFGISFCNDGPSFICFFDKNCAIDKHITKISKLLRRFTTDLQILQPSVDTCGICRE